MLRGGASDVALRVSALCAAVLVASDGLAQGADDGSRAELATSAQAFARCHREERNKPVPDCWARFVALYRTTATESEIAYAEEHAKVAPPPVAAGAEEHEKTPSHGPATPEQGAAAEQAQAPSPGPRAGTPVLQAKVGLLAVGAGSRSVESECTRAYRPACPASSTASQNDRPAFGVGLDALLHLGTPARIGLSLFYVPTSKTESNGQTTTLGSNLWILAVGEWLFPLGYGVRLAARAHIGPVVLLPGGDFQDALDRSAAQCKTFEIQQGTACHADSGPFAGYALGAGIGALYGDGRVHPRADLLLQYVSLDTGGVELAGLAGPINQTSSFSSTRMWFMGGVEF